MDILSLFVSFPSSFAMLGKVENGDFGYLWYSPSFAMLGKVGKGFLSLFALFLPSFARLEIESL